MNSLIELDNLIDKVCDEETAKILHKQLRVVGQDVDAGWQILNRLEIAVVEIAILWRIQGWKPDDIWLQWIPSAIAEACEYLYSVEEYMDKRKKR